MTLEEKIRMMLAEAEEVSEVSEETIDEAEIKPAKEVKAPEIEGFEAEDSDKEAKGEKGRDKKGSELKVEAAKCDDEGEDLEDKDSEDDEKDDDKTQIVLNPKKSKEVKMEEISVSEQVSSLLEVEGLSEDFKIQAVSIFEAAVEDKVLQIKESLEEQYEQMLSEERAELVEMIDGFMDEVANEWLNENRLPLEKSFRLDLAESLIDGLRQLFVEHHVEIPAESESALDLALTQIESLEESIAAKDQEVADLVESINEMKKATILESYAKDMTQTQFDRFTQLVEHVKFASEEQYNKQLGIIYKNFNVIAESKKVEAAVDQKVLAESAPVTVDPINNDQIAQFAAFLSKTK